MQHKKLSWLLIIQGIHGYICERPKVFNISIHTFLVIQVTNSNLYVARISNAMLNMFYMNFIVNISVVQNINLTYLDDNISSSSSLRKENDIEHTQSTWVVYFY